MTQKGAVVTVDRFPRLQMIQASEVSNEAVEAADSDRCRFDAQRLNLLNWDALWFDLERFRRQRHLDNVTVRKETLRPMLSTPDWYHVLVPSQMWNLTMGNIRHWQSIAFELLSGALERCFNYHKRKYLDPRMELVLLSRQHENLPSEGENYILVVEANEDYLIEDIKQLKSDLASVGWRSHGHIQGLRLGTHLYQPLLYSEKISIQPVALNKSEFRFVDDLRQWLAIHEKALETDGKRLFLLRNLAKRGVGFFEAGNFYPDFILWCLNKDGTQRICFIDPHGLEHEGPGSDKIQFSANIKHLEQRLGDPSVTLDSVILSPNANRLRIEHLWTQQGQTAPDLDKLHVFFQGEGSYLTKVLGIVSG